MDRSAQSDARHQERDNSNMGLSLAGVPMRSHKPEIRTGPIHLTSDRQPVWLVGCLRVQKWTLAVIVAARAHGLTMQRQAGCP